VRGVFIPADHEIAARALVALIVAVSRRQGLSRDC
jgi:hypothetical protein